MEEMHEARYGERVLSPHALSRCATPPAPSCVRQPRSSPTRPLGFCEGFVT